MDVGLITIIMFGSLAAGLALGLPLAFALGGLAMVFTFFLWGPDALYVIAPRFLATMTSWLLVAVLLFVFMGITLERSGIADDLFSAVYNWMGPVKGGLAMASVLTCTIFAAMSGISGAVIISVGVVALPAMFSRNYDKRIAVGCIAAGGALGVLIPPSVLMILYALCAGESVGGMFLGGVFPGLLLSTMFCTYIGVRCLIQPQLGPVPPKQERPNWREKFGSLRAVILPTLLIAAVLGSIVSGLATPTEAAGVGAAGSLICAAIRRSLKWQIIKEICYRTLRLNCMILWLVVGAACFTTVYCAIGGPRYLGEMITALEVNRWIVLIGIQCTFFILGMFLDPGGIVLLCTPIFVPIITMLDFNPLWFGILFVVNMEMAFLTPPFGFNLFYLKGIVPEGVTMGDIYRSITPFVALQAIGLAAVMIFPQIALWLPNIVIKGGG